MWLTSASFPTGCWAGSRTICGKWSDGRWLARMAEGYTALIPKEGPPGPLNTRPLTVLSMVYRLWAGVRLADAIAWQES